MERGDGGTSSVAARREAHEHREVATAVGAWRRRRERGSHRAQQTAARRTGGEAGLGDGRSGRRAGELGGVTVEFHASGIGWRRRGGGEDGDDDEEEGAKGIDGDRSGLSAVGYMDSPV